MEDFLVSTDIIDWRHPDVSARARRLRAESNDPLVIAQRCFEWVRDEIKHTADYGLKAVTCAASVCEQTVRIFARHMDTVVPAVHEQSQAGRALLG